jgi:hypothetical protein
VTILHVVVAHDAKCLTYCGQGVAGLEAQIRIARGDEVAEMASLWAWLKGERDLVGKVQAVSYPPGDAELGGMVDVLAVALGSGGTGAILAQSLTVWLRTRRGDVSVSVTTGDRTVTVEAKSLGPGEVLSVLEHVLIGGGDV